MGSSGILQESCCKIPAKSHKISQDLVGMQEKKDLFLEDLARAFLLGIVSQETEYRKCDA